MGSAHNGLIQHVAAGVLSGLALPSSLNEEYQPYMPVSLAESQQVLQAVGCMLFRLCYLLLHPCSRAIYRQQFV